MVSSGLLASGLAARTAEACDLCAIYSAAQARGEIGSGFQAGVAEQFTRYATLQLDGVEVPNEVGQKLNSSISQVFFGWNFLDNAGVQLNLPLIYRSFRRPVGFDVEEGTESGLGDMALLGHYQIVLHDAVDTTWRWTLLGGVKFPTGNTDRLREEFFEVEIPGAPESGIHGHDLTLGSGSYDGLVGTSVFARWKKLFLGAHVQYAIRSEGDYDYQFANDLTWSGGPGFFLIMTDDATLSVEAIVSGEHKDLDTFRGEDAADTGITAVYLGPRLQFTWREFLSASLGADLPVLLDNTALQIVPNYRVRFTFGFRF